MSLTLPYPNTPLNGQPGDPVPVNANFTAIAQAIQSFDGSQIAAGTIVESALAATIDPVIRGNETISNFIYTGCVWSSVSGLAGTMTGGTLYVQGNRIISPGVVSHTFTASKDTYIDIDKLGNVTYVAVTNGATSGMTLTANSVRVALVVTGSSTIGSVTQSGSDPLGNPIYPISPSGLNAWINYTPIFTGFSAAPTATGTRYTQIGKTVIVNYSCFGGTSNTTAMTVSLPVTASTSGLGSYVRDFVIRAQDNSSVLTNPGVMEFDIGATTANVFKDLTGAGWTGSNLKGFRATIMYEVP